MERQQLRLPNDTSKYLSQFKYVEAARYRDEEWLSKPGVIRVMEGPKDNRVPKRMDVNSEVEQFADQYNREGIYTSVWQYRNKHAQAGEPYLGSLYFDFDSHSVDIARGEAINLYQYLREYCEDGAVHIYFSGSKGFHIECEPIALGINAGEDLAGLYRSIASDLASNLELSTLDFQVYDIRRMWRLANTRHQSTGLYKRRLTEQILFGGVDLIKEFAEEPGSSDEIPEQSFSAKANEWFREYLYKYEEAQKPTQYSVQDLVNRFNRYGSSTVRIEPNVEKEFDPVALFEGCPAILKHWEAAEKNHHLDHEARLFLCSILTYSEEAIWYLHEILKNCFVGDSLVLTKRGQIPISKVVPGDLVLTHQGNWKPVLNVLEKTVDNTVTINGYGSRLQCTPDHVFLTDHKEDKWTKAIDLVGLRWLSPSSFAENEVPQLKRSTHKYCSEPKISFDLGKDFYWLVGLYLGDGCLSKSGDHSGQYNTIVYTVHIDQRYEVQKRIESLGLKYTFRQVGLNKTVARFDIRNILFARWLLEHCGHGAKAKEFPVHSLGIKRELRTALLDGYIYADGYTQQDERYKNSELIRCTTTSHKLAVSGKLLAQSLGFFSMVFETHRQSLTTVIEGRTVNQSPIVWELRLTKSGEAEFNDGFMYGKVRKIEENRELITVYDLEVLDDHSFIVNGIVVHNCDDYNPDISRAHISDWIRRRENGTGGRPYSCKRANDAGVGCGNCELEPKKKWIKIGDKLVETDEETQPSPIRFAYHNKKGG